jgi:hypothetical protein
MFHASAHARHLWIITSPCLSALKKLASHLLAEWSKVARHQAMAEILSEVAQHRVHAVQAKGSLPQRHKKRHLLSSSGALERNKKSNSGVTDHETSFNE